MWSELRRTFGACYHIGPSVLTHHGGEASSQISSLGPAWRQRNRLGSGPHPSYLISAWHGHTQCRTWVEWTGEHPCGAGASLRWQKLGLGDRAALGMPSQNSFQNLPAASEAWVPTLWAVGPRDLRRGDPEGTIRTCLVGKGNNPNKGIDPLPLGTVPGELSSAGRSGRPSAILVLRTAAESARSWSRKEKKGTWGSVDIPVACPELTGGLVRPWETTAQGSGLGMVWAGCHLTRGCRGTGW